MKVLILSGIVLGLCAYALGCRPIIRFYESEGYGNEYVEVAREFIGVHAEANLTAKGFKNWNMYYCPEGVWMAYEFENFTGSSYILSGQSNATSGHDSLYNCWYENTGRKFRSVKIIGSPADYSASALVTYSERYEEGDETTFLNDTRIINSSFDSMILVGNEEVELFTSTAYSGLSVCVRPKNGYINDWTSFEQKNDDTDGKYLYTSLTSLLNIFGTNQFHSFRFGCATKTNTLLASMQK